MVVLLVLVFCAAAAAVCVPILLLRIARELEVLRQAKESQQLPPTVPRTRKENTKARKLEDLKNRFSLTEMTVEEYETELRRIEG